ncbi:MAG: M20/M25/M40 family metallo-hydrolase [Thermoleophilia bacterium]|nr:M20/M25/M40 family metallo-hydrolase [Thermoleophilia bacterium]
MDVMLLRALADASGPSGHEDRVRALVLQELAGLTDRVDTDPMGCVDGVRTSTDAPAGRLMLAAHMDEIGLMITHVDDRGFAKFIPLGGWDAKTLVDQRVLVQGREDLVGIVGTTPVHLMDEAARTRAPKIEDLAIDLCMDGERAQSLVRPGDVATRIRELAEVGDLVTGKALDNRVGVYVMIEGLRAAGQSRMEVHATATSQEEVGLRGARIAAHRIAPHIAVAIDTCPADDGPGTPKDGPTTRLGEGAAIRVMDASAIGHAGLVDLLVDLATERDIPHQLHVSGRGGTDTQSIQLSGQGAIAGCISIPTRYVHTAVEACHPDDIDAAVALTAALIEEAHRLLPGN